MDTIPMTSRSLDRYYHINGDTFEKQYKEVLSGYREWSELSHAEDWLVFPENIGESVCIGETAPSNGALHTIVSNRSSRGGKSTIIAIVKGVGADAVIEALMRIDEDKRMMVKEITMDMSNFMRLIARRCFLNSMRTIGRFHIQKLACDALLEVRVAHRWDAISYLLTAGIFFSNLLINGQEVRNKEQRCSLKRILILKRLVLLHIH